LKQERPNKTAAHFGHTEILSGRFTQKAEKQRKKEQKNIFQK
jgi:hypothetical protein